MEGVIFAISLFRAGAKMGVPLIMTSVGEIFAERAGVINIGLEGMMLSGALGGVIGAFFFGSPWMGLLFGMTVGVALALLFSLITVSLGGDQVVCGAALNLLALGMTGVVYRRIFGVTGAALTVDTFKPVSLPMIDGIPVLGQLASGHTAPVYIGFLIVPVALWILNYTAMGLSIRAVGEYPKAADTAGVPVYRIQHACVLVSGALAGMAGAYLSLAHANTFIEGMSAGRGFIALAMVIFGRWHPVGVMGAGLLFGLATAVQFQLQAIGAEIPYQFFLMLPYALTLLVLIWFAGRSQAPAWLARPYQRR